MSLVSLRNSFHISMKPSTYIIAPCIVIALMFITEAFLKDNSAWALYAVPFVIITAGIFVMSPQIDWWVLKRNPKPLPQNLENLLAQYQPYYKKLSPEMKTLYSKKAALFLLGNNFFRPSSDENERAKVPEDLKLIIACAGAQILLGREELYFSKFDNFMICPNTFPTPVHPAQHHSELFAPDSVIIFSAPALMHGFTQFPRVFQLALYELSRVFFTTMATSDSTPKLDDSHWNLLENISGMNKNFVESTIGLANPDLIGVASHHFFVFPQRFSQLLPDVFQLLCNAFNQNPLKEGSPIIAV